MPSPVIVQAERESNRDRWNRGRNPPSRSRVRGPQRHAEGRVLCLDDLGDVAGHSTPSLASSTRTVACGRTRAGLDFHELGGPCIQRGSTFAGESGHRTQGPSCQEAAGVPVAAHAPVVAETLGVGVVSTHPSLRSVCDGSRSQAAAWSAETMAPKGPRELASSRCDVGPFECWSPGARQERRQVPFVGRAKAVTTTYSCTKYFGVVHARARTMVQLASAWTGYC